MDNTLQAGREMTFGEKAVGLTFNPSGDKKVQEVKELYAKIIDITLESAYRVDEENSKEKQALATEAVRQAQTAQMWAVKAITYQF
jgi:hypothetical protein